MKVNKEYTPGKWVADASRILIEGEMIAAANRITTDENVDVRRKERHANARLIAAAPDLVEALEQFYNYMRHSKEDAPTQKWEEEFEDLEQIAGEALLKAGVLTDQD